jgi:hypothetical protein
MNTSSSMRMPSLRNTPELSVTRSPITDHHVALDVGVIAAVAIGPDHRAGHHVSERPDPDA